MRWQGLVDACRNVVVDVPYTKLNANKPIRANLLRRFICNLSKTMAGIPVRSRSLKLLKAVFCQR